MFILGLDPAAYNPTGLRAYDDADLQHEYARIRREANQRLSRLGESEFSEAQIYKDNIDKFIPVKQISDRRELERLIIQGERFLMAKGSSASGQREIRRNAIEGLKDMGISFVNTKNYGAFSRFMADLKSNKIEGAKYVVGEKDEYGKFSVKEEKLEELFNDWQDENWFVEYEEE